jgi:hypothetical protein
MIRFNTPTLGEVEISFRHNLPSVEIKRNNDLCAMVKNMKITAGFTECSLQFTDIHGDVVEYFGMAHTHPADQYKKEVGRELSLKRAIEASEVSDGIGREIMAGYYAR